MTDTLTKTTISSLYNVQPTSDTTKPHNFPFLLYTKENPKFMRKSTFLLSDLADTENGTLCNLLIKHKNSYATNKTVVGNISSPFRIRLKSNAQYMTKRPCKVPIHYGDKLNALLTEIEIHSVIEQIGKLVLLHKINLPMVLSI